MADIRDRTPLFQEILDEVQPLVDARRSALDSEGLNDGSAIVLDYLDHNEGGCAFWHLVYMITEPPIEISPTCLEQLARLGSSLGLEPGRWEGAAPASLFGILPDAWTIDRIRGETPLSRARLLPLRTPVWEAGANDLVAIDPVVVLDTGSGYVLVLERESGEWQMGWPDGDDILCWANHGPDLAAAIRSL